MSASLTTQIISPKQVSDIYSQSRQFPKQRNTFLVRFQMTGASAASARTITYAVKAFDRPIIQPITEEVNQYNKKRQVYTGYKKSPLKCIFYDDAAGSAQKMWAAYSQYYFGDFATVNGTNAAFSDDIVSGVYLDPGNTGFGLITKTSRWFFQNITILHLHNSIYDLYTLVNPRIMAFNPDELDYEQSGMAMITAEFAYEAVSFTPNYNGTAALQPEFANGSTPGMFNGRTSGTQADGITEPGAAPSTSASPLSSITSGIQQLVNGAGQAVNQATSGLTSSYFNSATSGALSSFGNFIFGAGQTAASTAASLASLVTSNPQLAQTLGIGSASGNPLAVNAPLGVYATTAGYTGAPAGYPGAVAGVSAGMSSNYGSISQLLGQASLAASQIAGTGAGFVNALTGLTLSPQAFGVINSQQPGSAQYGYNSGSTQPTTGSTLPSNDQSVEARAANAGYGSVLEYVNAEFAAREAAAGTGSPAISQPNVAPSTTPAPAVANPNASPDDSNLSTSQGADPDSGIY